MKNEEKKPVDVANDDQMVALKLRNPKVSQRDPSVWSKTEEEKKSLKYFRGLFNFNTSNWAAPRYKIGTPSKLIVFLKGFKRVEKGEPRPKSTVTHICVNSEVEDILSSYKKQNLEIVKYVWQGKTYRANEVPPRLRRNYTVKL